MLCFTVSTGFRVLPSSQTAEVTSDDWLRALIHLAKQTATTSPSQQYTPRSMIHKHYTQSREHTRRPLNLRLLTSSSRIDTPQPATLLSAQPLHAQSRRAAHSRCVPTLALQQRWTWQPPYACPSTLLRGSPCQPPVGSEGRCVVSQAPSLLVSAGSLMRLECGASTWRR